MIRIAKLGSVLAVLLFFQGTLCAQPKEDPDPTRFEGEITAFQQWDLKNSFPNEAILFVGSSSIRMWNTAEAFSEYPIINRGFGGSHISDVLYFYDQVISKYNPSLIVFYAGDNDIAADKTISQVVEDYKALTNKALDDFPEAKFVYIPIKPSASRWNYWETMNEVNQRVKVYNKEHDRLLYVDLATPLLGEDGKPDEKFYLDDQLHLSEAGYEVWNEIMGDKLNRIITKN